MANNSNISNVHASNASACLQRSELIAYLEGSTSEQESRKMEEHFSECDLCSEAIDTLYAMPNSEREALLIPVLNPFTDLSRQKHRVGITRQYRQTMFAAVAGVALLVGISVLYMVLGRTTPAEKEIAEARTRPIEVQPDAVATDAISENSVISVDTAAKATTLVQEPKDNIINKGDEPKTKSSKSEMTAPAAAAMPTTAAAPLTNKDAEKEKTLYNNEALPATNNVATTEQVRSESAQEDAANQVDARNYSPESTPKKHSIPPVVEKKAIGRASSNVSQGAPVDKVIQSKASANTVSQNRDDRKAIGSLDRLEANSYGGKTESDLLDQIAKEKGQAKIEAIQQLVNKYQQAGKQRKARRLVKDQLVFYTKTRDQVGIDAMESLLKELE